MALICRHKGKDLSTKPHEGHIEQASAFLRDCVSVSWKLTQFLCTRVLEINVCRNESIEAGSYIFDDGLGQRGQGRSEVIYMFESQSNACAIRWDGNILSDSLYYLHHSFSLSEAHPSRHNPPAIPEKADLLSQDTAPHFLP